MARLVMDGMLWRNTSGRKIMRERTNRNAQALYLSAGYSDFHPPYQILLDLTRYTRPAAELHPPQDMHHPTHKRPTDALHRPDAA